MNRTTGRRAGVQTDRQRNRRTDKQTVREIDGQMGRQMDGQTDRRTDRKTHGGPHRPGGMQCKQLYRQAGQHHYRQRQTDRDKDRDRGTTIETNRRTFTPTTVSQKCLTSASSVGE